MISAPDFKFKQIVLALLREGEAVSFKNDNIIIKDKENKIIHQSSCYRIFSLFLVGHSTISSGLLDRSKKFKFSIVLFGYNMRLMGTWNSKTEGNTILRKIQYEYEKYELAQYIVENKIKNQIAQLKKIRNKEKETKINITKLEELEHRLPNRHFKLQDILGIEGIASKIYFSSMFDCTKWGGRKPRTKIDEVNTLLDIGYTILFNFVEALLNLYGFDIYQGVYHQVFYQRKSLVCDLIEVFRPIIDYRIRKAFKLSEIDSQDFLVRDNRYYLVGQQSQKYVKIFIKELLEYKMEIFLYIQSYYRSFIRKRNIEEFQYFHITS